MSYNDHTFNTMQSNSSNKRLTRRPMETPGLDVNSIPPQQVQYNYAQPTMYSPPQEPQTIPSQQQFYYNDFTSIPSQPQHGYGNSDFGYMGSAPTDNINHRQHYTPSPGPNPQQTQPMMFNPANNLVDAFGSNPLLAGATVRYGQKILGQVVDENVGKYTSGISSEIKRYFAVDTRYVITKLGLLLFPFAHTDWSIMLESTGQTDDRRRARPKTDVNAPDLYIPTVAFVTYLLFLGLILGKHGQFSPELLSVQASRVLAWEVIVVLVEILALYVTNIQSSLRALDLTAYSGYKYFGIISCIPIGLLLGETAFYLALLYIGIAFIYFLLFSMRWQLNSIATVANVGQPVVMVEYKRKRTLYFLILAVAIQPITAWYLISYLTFTMK
ncbi:protein YIF1B [Aphis gossypii]|uniref:Protein YIF1 n=1 Tax=Aphis gossypii TaxID=80765 RepID=A0A9P0J7W3_APHGO|nr:protein YIF1B [Aphis gossypii]CAH1731616.1 unnamed protein product [Aphis gossypii]